MLVPLCYHISEEENMGPRCSCAALCNDDNQLVIFFYMTENKKKN